MDIDVLELTAAFDVIERGLEVLRAESGITACISELEGIKQRVRRSLSEKELPVVLTDAWPRPQPAPKPEPVEEPKAE